MLYPLSQQSPKDIYLAMIQCIVPRPIAWVLSDNGQGTLNLAPFSYFNGVCSQPPLLSLSIGKKPTGEKKDTWRNIEERSKFVVHIAREGQGSLVSATAASREFGHSEVTENDIPLTEEHGFGLPRIQAAPIAFDCVKERIIEVGEGPQALVLGRIINLYVDDSVLAQGQENRPFEVDIAKLNPLARLGGNDYATLGRSFTIARPK